MVLVLDTVKDEDFPNFIDVMFDAVGQREPFVNACYPHGYKQDGQPDFEGRQEHAKIMLALWKEDPTQHWMKVTDTDIKKIIGVAEYQIYNDVNNKPAEDIIDAPDGYWDSAEDREWAQALFKSQFEDRWAFIRETQKPTVCLNILLVDPKNQRRGAGSMLTQWGVDQADKLGADMLIEAFTPGIHLYQNMGFMVQRQYISKVPAKFDDRLKQRITFMHRAPASPEQSL